MTLPPPRTADWYARRLAPPPPGQRVAVVIDTDAANEIDDPFALAWALLSPQRLDVRAVYAVPYSFEHRRQELLRARQAQAAPALASLADQELLAHHAGRLQALQARGLSLEGMAGWPIFCTPAEGMARSHAAIVRVFDALGLSPQGRVFMGSTGYFDAHAVPQASPAVRHLIDTARAMPRDGPPLYVLAIGCITHVAQALLLAPDIAEHIVVVWTSGYPSHAPQVNYSLNMEQDMPASKLLFDSGVPLVYLPGFHVGAQLRLSLPEMQAHVQPAGRIGAHLHALYLENPLRDFGGFDVHAPGFSWVIWDLINVAWLLDADWVPSSLQPTPLLGDDRRWRARPAPVTPMREAHAVARDAIFADFFAALRRAPT